MELVDGDTPMVRCPCLLLMWCLFLTSHRIEPGMLTIRVANAGDCQPKQEVQDQQDPARQEEGTKCRRRRCCCRGIGLLPGLFGCICQLLGAQSNQISV